MRSHTKFGPDRVGGGCEGEDRAGVKETIGGGDDRKYGRGGGM